MGEITPLLPSPLTEKGTTTMKKTLLALCILASTTTLNASHIAPAALAACRTWVPMWEFFP